MLRPELNLAGKNWSLIVLAMTTSHHIGSLLMGIHTSTFNPIQCTVIDRPLVTGSEENIVFETKEQYLWLRTNFSNSVKYDVDDTLQEI